MPTEERKKDAASGTTRQVTLRTYQPRDIPRMVNLIESAIPQIPNYAMITPDRGRIEYVLRHNIDNATSFCGWVLCDTNDDVQGGGAGWCVQNLMSKDMVADDVFMWVEPKYRSYFAASILVQTYFDWAKSKNAKIIRASHTGGSWPRGTREWKLYDLLLKRLGFEEVGSVYHYNAYKER